MRIFHPFVFNSRTIYIDASGNIELTWIFEMRRVLDIFYEPEIMTNSTFIAVAKFQTRKM